MRVRDRDLGKEAIIESISSIINNFYNKFAISWALLGAESLYLDCEMMKRDEGKEEKNER